ncbi:MAG: peptidylprolyl isomerase [Gammaproteobacteria bacterium]|nr:MAG: peptidylprolyl isomerase [Gammaproteobacteria bacterium]
MHSLRTLSWFIASLLVVGCATMTAVEMEQRFGALEPRERVVDVLPAGAVDYWRDIKPIVEARCIVCHACYDAPCQLKMSSIEGIERGATEARVYDAARLTAAPMTRLFEDARSVAEWRAKDFFPVLNEHADTPQANRDGGVMHRILRLKAQNPLPDTRQLPKSFDLSLDRKQFCAQPGTFDKFANKHPLWGMPYALPGLADEEQNTLLSWLEAGAPYTARPPLAPGFVAEIDIWEAFLNGDSLKARLSSRYIYEHLFLAHLYFPALSDSQFFRIVRSATPPGAPIELIATRRPYNDPGVERVYYRIDRAIGSIVAKTHMPYALDAARMDRWQALFMDADYEVDTLPSYAVKTASNPFVTFDALPVRSRYKFMLDEAQYTIMTFIKGPVCRGQAALNVINDNFWVFFINPDDPKLEILADFLSTRQKQLTFPASSEDIYRPIKYWRQYAAQQKTLLAEIDAYLADHLAGGAIMNPDLNLVWDGDGTNDNAALTVFRHFDSATVEKGLVGNPPKTAWLIGYTLLERIQYLLVTGYDVYGNVGHQLLSRVYMDFLRMEGEMAFLQLLPQEARNRERNFWYRDAEKEVTQYMTLPRFESESVPDIDYRTDNEKLELYGMLREHLKAVLPDRYAMTAIRSTAARESIARLNGLTGLPANLMPQATFIEIAGPSGNYYVTLIRNNAHLNITSIFGEKKFRKPDEDTLAVVPGFLGAYPNAFLLVNEIELDRFAARVTALRTEGDYTRLLDDYGIRRTNPNFWRQSDAFHSAAQEQLGFEFGLFDYGRFENR